MADVSEMLKNFSSMMEGKEIPDNIKEMMSSLMKRTKIRKKRQRKLMRILRM